MNMGYTSRHDSSSIPSYLTQVWIFAAMYVALCGSTMHMISQHNPASGFKSANCRIMVSAAFGFQKSSALQSQKIARPQNKQANLLRMWLPAIIGGDKIMSD